MPRVGLSADAVVAEAARAADELGLDKLTLALVAQRVDVRLPSLYKHVRGGDDLRRRLAILALGELAACLGAAAVGRSGAVALAALAAAYRDYAERRPGLYAAGAVRAPDPADGEHVAAAEAVYRVVVAVLAGYGIEGDDAVDTTRILRAALHGFVSLEAGGGFGMPRDVDRTFERLVAGLDAVFSGQTRLPDRAVLSRQAGGA